MIFLSHTYKDKELVRQIAQTLERVFGQNRIFYDEWSIQPGDSIIGKMDEGLSKCKYFLLFISANSISSSMVTLEWHNALMKINRGIKIIPVRLDSTAVPTILSHILHIDLYSHGLDIATRQIIDVVSGNNTYRPVNDFCNLLATVDVSSTSVAVEIAAKHYLEPHSNYAFVVDNAKDISCDVLEQVLVHSGKTQVNIDGVKDCCFVNIMRPTSPGFPIAVQLTAKEGTVINLYAVLHEVAQNKYKPIPIETKR